MRATALSDPKDVAWTGRLALQVQDNAAQSFSAGFELKGRPETGQLTLMTPLGGTAAQLTWAPGSAALRAGSESRQFDSIDSLTLAATGAALPLEALFDWLGGVNTPVAGWEADLSLLAEGRMRARRLSPPPSIDLRIVLDTK